MSNRVVLSGITFVQDIDVLNWRRRVYREGGTVSDARLALINTLIAGLKTDGVWTKLDRLLLFAAENVSSALVDLVGGTLATRQNSCTFTADRGFTGGSGGNAGYIETNANAFALNGQLQLNSATVGIWPVTASTAGVMCGAFTASGRTQLTKQGATYTFHANENAAVNPANFSDAATGFYAGSRTASSNRRIFKNGSFVFQETSEPSTNVPNVTFNVCARNISGTPGQDVDDAQIACFLFGGSLTDTDHSNLYSRLRTYMTAVGVP